MAINTGFAGTLFKRPPIPVNALYRSSVLHYILAATLILTGKHAGGGTVRISETANGGQQKNGALTIDTGTLTSGSIASYLTADARNGSGIGFDNTLKAGAIDIDSRGTGIIASTIVYNASSLQEGSLANRQHTIIDTGSLTIRSGSYGIAMQAPPSTLKAAIAPTATQPIRPPSPKASA